LRSEVDLSREKIGYKIREAESQKIPLILVVGDKEVANRTASLRIHTHGDKGEVGVDQFLEKIIRLNENKSPMLAF
jgi:threonyl-tRNA synthetase